MGLLLALIESGSVATCRVASAVAKQYIDDFKPCLVCVCALQQEQEQGWDEEVREEKKKQLFVNNKGVDTVRQQDDEKTRVHSWWVQVASVHSSPRMSDVR